MESFSERLEIRVRPEMMRRLREEARARNLPKAEIVRRAIEAFLSEDRLERLAAARALFQIDAPMGDWEQIRREIDDARDKEGSQWTP